MTTFYKPDPPDPLADDLRRVLDQLGAAHALPAVLATLHHRLPPVARPSPVSARGKRAGLSPREAQLLDGMSRGLSNAEIGGELYLSVDTVKTFARRLFGKLGCHNRAGAVSVAYQWGLLGDPS